MINGISAGFLVLKIKDIVEEGSGFLAPSVFAEVEESIVDLVESTEEWVMSATFWEGSEDVEFSLGEGDLLVVIASEVPSWLLWPGLGGIDLVSSVTRESAGCVESINPGSDSRGRFGIIANLFILGSNGHEFTPDLWNSLLALFHETKGFSLSHTEDAGDGEDESLVEHI